MNEGRVETMSKKEKEPENERPKIYVTSRGERYVKAEELLTSKRGREALKKMAAFAKELRASKSPPKRDDDR